MGGPKAGVWTFSVLKAYPGDAYVDLVGAHYYDVGSQFTRQRAFDKFLDATRYGGPHLSCTLVSPVWAGCRVKPFSALAISASTWARARRR